VASRGKPMVRKRGGGGARVDEGAHRRSMATPPLTDSGYE